jgi:hypothetical protein
MKDAPSQPELMVETDLRLHGFVLPPHLAALVNPKVLAEREKVIEARLLDEGRTRVLRRRCAEIVANHLLQEVADDAA